MSNASRAGRSARSAGRSLSAFVAWLTLPSAATAQAVDGHVVERGTGRDIPSVTVLVGRTSVTTDATGRFLLVVDGETVRVSLRRLGYAPLDTLVRFVARDTMELTLSMAVLPARLDTVTVQAGGDMPGSIPEFEERRLKAVGHFITRAELRKQDERSFVDVLRASLPSLSFEPIGGRILLYNPGQQAPGALTAGSVSPLIPSRTPVYDVHSPRICYVQVVMDGNPIYRAASKEEPPDFAMLRTQEFDGVEYYSSPSRTPVQFRSAGALCGTLVLWSRRR